MPQSAGKGSAQSGCGQRHAFDGHSASPTQLTRNTGKTLENLDLSNCNLTDEACVSIVKHCQCIKVLGLSNVKEITGAPLNKLFTDRERRKDITGVTMSGSRKVYILIDVVSMCYMDTIM